MYRQDLHKFTQRETRLRNDILSLNGKMIEVVANEERLLYQIRQQKSYIKDLLALLNPYLKTEGKQSIQEPNFRRTSSDSLEEAEPTDVEPESP